MSPSNQKHATRTAERVARLLREHGREAKAQAITGTNDVEVQILGTDYAIQVTYPTSIKLCNTLGPLVVVDSWNSYQRAQDELPRVLDAELDEEADQDGLWPTSV